MDFARLKSNCGQCWTPSEDWGDRAQVWGTVIQPPTMTQFSHLAPHPPQVSLSHWAFFSLLTEALTECIDCPLLLGESFAGTLLILWLIDLSGLPFSLTPAAVSSFGTPVHILGLWEFLFH